MNDQPYDDSTNRDKDADEAVETPPVLIPAVPGPDASSTAIAGAVLSKGLQDTEVDESKAEKMKRQRAKEAADDRLSKPNL